MTSWNETLWQQFGASIDMLENAIDACPDDVWDDGSTPQFWYMVYHTLFFLDLCLSGVEAGFTPPAPFNLDELDPAGILPDRTYSKAELRSYLQHGRAKCRSTLAALTDEIANRRSALSWLDLSMGELHLHNLRHVQHHTAQLNLILRQRTNSAPRWVRRADDRSRELPG
jgi:hypothetical protein